MPYLMGSVGTATGKTSDSPVLTTPALGTPSAGVMTNMTGGVTASIADNAITLAKMAGGTDGNIISYDASGDPVAIATGSDGQVFTSAGAGAAPAFATLASGKVSNIFYFTGTAGDMNTTNNTGTETICQAPVGFSATSGRIYVIIGNQQLATSNESGSPRQARYMTFGLYYGTTSRSISDTTTDTKIYARTIGRNQSDNTTAGRSQYITHTYHGYFTAGSTATHYVYGTISDASGDSQRMYGHNDAQAPHITTIYEVLS